MKLLKNQKKGSNCMKLYQLTRGRLEPLSMTECEVEEKEKTYICKGDGRELGYRKRISKADIGIAIGFSKDEVILLENNPSEAAKILIAEKESQLEILEKNVNRVKLEIHKLKQYVEEE